MPNPDDTPRAVPRARGGQSITIYKTVPRHHPTNKLNSIFHHERRTPFWLRKVSFFFVVLRRHPLHSNQPVLAWTTSIIALNDLDLLSQFLGGMSPHLLGRHRRVLGVELSAAIDSLGAHPRVEVWAWISLLRSRTTLFASFSGKRRRLFYQFTKFWMWNCLLCGRFIGGTPPNPHGRLHRSLGMDQSSAKQNNAFCFGKED
jgi:hypothetical protein